MKKKLPFLRAPTLLALLMFLSGCETLRFYQQAARGQLYILTERKPINTLIEAPETPPQLRRQLQLVQSIRAYAAAELQLPVGGAYSSFTQLQQPYPLWNLIAAPEFSLDPKRWCYPIAGCTSYRGYFDKSAANAKAAELRRDGFDVYLGPVPAYSTLGWFNDPVLSSFVYWPPERLARLLFHELAHRQLYIAGDTRFNENFATAVAQIALPQWRRRQGLPAPLSNNPERARQVNGLMLVARRQLQHIYSANLNANNKRALKAGTLRQLRRCYRKLSANWPGGFHYQIENANNATLALAAEYRSLVPAFVQLYQDNNRTWTAFYPAAASLAALPRQQRNRQLNTLLEHAQASSKKVTGPSLQSETCMSAAKMPLATTGN